MIADRRWGRKTADNCQRFHLLVGFKAEVGKMTTFDLWPIPSGGGAWGAGTKMWHPETPASYESLPAPLATQIPTLRIGYIHMGGGGALILDRCRAFDPFASVDAHLCFKGAVARHGFLPFQPIYRQKYEDFDQFWFWSKISRDRAVFRAFFVV